MKTSYQFYFAVIVIIFITSCTTTRDILMFQEPDNVLKKIYIPAQPVEHKIKPFDNLYINISTVDPEINKIFNPSKIGDGFGSGTDQMYGSSTSKYLNGFVVALDSTITLPILGKVNLVGLNLTEAQLRVKAKAEEQLKEPAVQVKYLNFWVNLTGEVKSPGIYYNYEWNLNILDAIGLANGITEYADLKNILVKRQLQNEILTYKIDFTNNSVYLSDAFYLQPNDLVYIPPSDLKRRNVNSDTYNKFLGTISTLMLAATLFLNIK